MKQHVYHAHLLHLLASIGTAKDAQYVLDALCTPAEAAEFDLRLEILRRLVNGESQRHIARSLGVGLATVSRGARVLQHDVPTIQRYIIRTQRQRPKW